MRIGCLQFAPQVGDVNNNLNRADAVLSKANLGDLDLLVLPELAFTGYNFKSLNDITPFLEPSGSGITSLWARTVALKYNCIVAVGYPEKADVSAKWPTGPEYYNSVIIVNADGETTANYRKSFLYYTDETWALEGQGFYDGLIPSLGNTSIGICMDLNPYKFEAPWHAFEFAFHVLEAESNLVIVSMAWMTREDPRCFSRMPNEPDMETLTYWVTRLEPLIRADKPDEIIVVFCNRTGNEDDVVYAGTSAVVGIHDGEVKMYGLLGRGEKELLVVDTNNSPYAKLVYRPDASGSGVEGVGKLQRNDKTDNPRSNENQRNSPYSPYYPKDTQQNRERKNSSGDRANSSYHDASASSFDRQASPPSTQSTLPEDGASKSPRRRQTPTITTPELPELAKTDSARSAEVESLNIPTPSLPSPTPLTFRPRLIIPESPPILPYQYPPGHPISAASLRSERSIQSIQSSFSQASISTVRSNPRPPEDSTPYPDSALPLSGYPANSFKSGRRMYGGHVGMPGTDDASNPSLSLDEMSPTTPNWFHRPSESTLETPLSAGCTPATAVGRHPEPFPWGEIIGQTRPLSANTTADRVEHSLTLKNLRQFDTLSPQSNASSNRTNRTIISESAEAFKDAKHVTSTTDWDFVKPSSYKPRTASRKGGREQTGSPFDPRDISTIPQHLEGRIQRGEPVPSWHSKSMNATPVQDRAQSTKSRNCSRNRPRNDANVRQDHDFIQIGASPSIFRRDTQSQHQSLLGAVFQERSNSFNNANVISKSVSRERTRTPGSGPHSARPASRAASRGRPSASKSTPINGVYSPEAPVTERSTSADSNRNELLHSRTRKTRSRGRQSRTRTASSGQTGRSMSRDILPLEIERVESVLCPNCPVHSPRSSSNIGRHRDSALPLNRSPAKQARGSPSSQSGIVANDSQVNTPEPMEPPQPAGNPHSTIAKPAEEHTNKFLQASSMNEVAETSDSGSVAETLQTISTPGWSPATPMYFNPSTPKAMTSKADDSDVDLFPMGHLDGVDTSAPHPETDTVPVA
ncbi:hypothetical protein FZEAL_3538 [Fusarium zealandicum]|uniref:CN hydrolase domain-containing protein n=1 Tax=Fusarium zealandicum TaxID=1053134 RepID=A0A8H4UPC3_9HYPO|nr:hypothetical protein FZEAL_3538 [Fusarium zealandicum]